MELEDLKKSLLSLKEGEIRSIDLVERGPYAEPEDIAEEDAATGTSERLTSALEQVAEELKKENEDLTIVKRKEAFTPMIQADFDWFIDQLKAAHHLIFIECLELGTTEIKGFLQTLKESDHFGKSKVVLLDLPTLEYMMLKERFAGSIDL